MNVPIVGMTLLFVAAGIVGCADGTSGLQSGFAGPARLVKLRVHLATPVAREDYDAINDEHGQPLYVQPEPLLTERDVIEAEALHGEQRNLVLLRFKAWAAGRLESASKRSIGQRLAVFLDERFLLSAVIAGPIESGSICLDGGFSRRRAEEIVRGVLIRE